MADCPSAPLDTRTLLWMSLVLFEPFGQPGHRPRIRALALSWFTSIVLSRHPQAERHIGAQLMPNVGDQLKRYAARHVCALVLAAHHPVLPPAPPPLLPSLGATNPVLDVLHHVTPLVQSTNTLSKHRAKLAGKKDDNNESESESSVEDEDDAV